MDGPSGGARGEGNARRGAVEHRGGAQRACGSDDFGKSRQREEATPPKSRASRLEFFGGASAHSTSWGKRISKREEERETRGSPNRRLEGARTRGVQIRDDKDPRPREKTSQLF